LKRIAGKAYALESGERVGVAVGGLRQLCPDRVVSRI
jgi:hypothetical protein